MSTFNSFLKYLRCCQRQTAVALKISNFGLDRLGTAVAQLECGLPGAVLEFGAPKAHKNTYCTVTGSQSLVYILTTLCTIIILQYSHMLKYGML